jgi:MATE family multidrug resistance protein
MIVLSQAKPILMALQVDKELAQLAATYMWPYLFCLLPERLHDINIMFLSNVNEEQVTMWITLATQSLGLLLHYGLLFGTTWGLTAAGLSVLGEALFSWGLSTCYLWRADIFAQFEIFTLRASHHFEQLKQIAKRGAALATLYLFHLPSMLASSAMYGWLGSSRLALHQAIVQSLVFFHPLNDAISQAVAVKVAQAKGEGDLEKVAHFSSIGLKLNLVVGLLTPAFFTIFASDFYHLFVPEASNEELPANLVRAAFFLVGIKQLLNIVAGNAISNLRAVYDVVVPGIIDLGVTLGVSIPLSYLLGFVLDYNLLGLYAASLVGCLVLNVIWSMRWNSLVAPSSVDLPLLQNGANGEHTAAVPSISSYGKGSWCNFFRPNQVIVDSLSLNSEGNNLLAEKSLTL